ncbi:hypothetical protein [Pseudotenacibaculum haliotis]|uniref:Uncharacterized protein n=1 Tax=Pseudotenacibaculum haliotis TaxID=1862138 RepID=A0ABW5LT99_9FLAO
MGLGSLSNIAKNYTKINVRISNDGEIVTIEKERDGLWKTNPNLSHCLKAALNS